MKDERRGKKPKLEKNELDEIVAQGNDLVRHARFPLTALEMDILYFCMSKIMPTDTAFMEQTFTVQEFCEACGIEVGGSQYRRLKMALKNIADKSAWVEFPNGVEMLVRWFDTFRFEKDSGTLTATFSQSVKPFLIGLVDRAKREKIGYTQVFLRHYIALKSKHSKRLYEILKTYMYGGKSTTLAYEPKSKKFTIKELGKLLNAENYLLYNDLRRFVIEKAVKEINEITDTDVVYTPVKDGKKVVGVVFDFQMKDNMPRYDAETEARIRTGEMSRAELPKVPPTNLRKEIDRDADFPSQMDIHGTPEQRIDARKKAYAPRITEQIAGYDIPDTAPEKEEQCITFTDLIYFAAAEGRKVGWAYKRGLEMRILTKDENGVLLENGRPTLSPRQQKDIYDICLARFMQ